MEETLALEVLAERLAEAFHGEPFVVAGEHLAGHGMDSHWLAERYTDTWGDYGVRWPMIEFAPTKFPTPQVYLYDAYEAEGKVEALDGILDCVRFGLGYIGVLSQNDVRGKRFAICVWDYRGVFRRKSNQDAVEFVVEPPDDPSLKLSLVTRDDGGITRKTFHEPTDVKVPLTGALHRLNMCLRHDDEIVCELLWDEGTERFRLEHDGYYHRPPVSTVADPIDAGSTVADLALPFMADGVLAQLVARDLNELDSTVQAGHVKSAVLLCGSILEAVLLDVLLRNEPEARQRLGRKWPDRASATDLVTVACSIVVMLPDGSTAPLLPPLTKAKGAVLVDHRDLIHPRAEIRAGAIFDAHTVQTMRGLLGEVLRDLREAHARGLLELYGAGKVA